MNIFALGGHLTPERSITIRRDPSCMSADVSRRVSMLENERVFECFGWNVVLEVISATLLVE